MCCRVLSSGKVEFLAFYACSTKIDSGSTPLRSPFPVPGLKLGYKKARNTTRPLHNKPALLLVKKRQEKSKARIKNNNLKTTTKMVHIVCCVCNESAMEAGPAMSCHQCGQDVCEACERALPRGLGPICSATCYQEHHGVDALPDHLDGQAGLSTG